jgi:hypothetical protein
MKHHSFLHDTGKVKLQFNDQRLPIVPQGTLGAFSPVHLDVALVNTYDLPMPKPVEPAIHYAQWIFNRKITGL